MRFLPSIVVAFILVVALIVVDIVQQRVLEKEKRELATSLLQKVQVTTNDGFSLSHRSNRTLAHEVGPSFDVDQAEFEKLAPRVIAPPLQLLRAELAPRFMTRHVYPLQGNEARIGGSPIALDGAGRPDLASELARGFPPVGTMRIVDKDIAELEVRFLSREDVRNEIVTSGMVSSVVRFDMVPDGMRTDEDAQLFDYLFQTRLRGAPDPELPAAWRQEGNMAPMETYLRYPVGDFLFYIRPFDGWRPTASDMVEFRLGAFGLALLMFAPVLLANRFAVTRLATRNRLAATETKMTALLENLPGAAFVYSRPPGNDRPGPEDRVTFLNRESCRKVWGVDADVAETNPLALWERATDKERSEAFIQTLSESVRHSRAWKHSWQIRTPDGVEKWLGGRGQPVRMKDGSVSWFCLVFDISEEMAREAELERQRDLAFQAQKNESIGHLTGGMAHDFNNLLAIIMGNVELLAEEEDDPEKTKWIAATLDATHRGSDLTRNMLAFARRARLAPEVLDLNAVLRNAKNWIGRTLPDSVVVETSLLAGLWKVSADQGSTESALLNLILNACDAMDGHGRLTLETANTRIDEAYVDLRGEELLPGRYVMLAVSDTGPGIPEEIRDNLFEPFVTTKEAGRGTGLGLSMVMGFMRQTGGTVQVYSEPESGTTFKLYFPAVTVPAEQQMQRATRSEGQDGAGARILLAEDEEGVREVLSNILERAGYVVTQASSGDDALSVFEANPDFDLLLTDIVMPGDLQGTGLAKAVRSIRNDLPVIFMSGYANEATIHGNGLRAEDHRLMKPVQRLELVEAVAKVIEGRAGVPRG